MPFSKVMNRLIHRTSRGISPHEFDTLTVISAWFWQRKSGPQGGNTRALGGAYLHAWGSPTPHYAGVRFWTLFNLVSLQHRDTDGGKLKAKHPGWSWRFAKLAPTLGFKKVDNYGGW